MKKGRCFIMRVKLKRVLSFVSAVVICGVSCVTSWFSVPVSAVGVFSPFNFYQLYQMLHGLLLGDGGGNSQTFGEWLEKNMTRTIGSGNDKHVFLLTPGEKLEDMMSEASIRLALGAACTDGGAAGMLKIKNLIDSWNEVYDTSDIGEIGSGSSAGLPGLDWVLSSNGIALFDCRDRSSDPWFYPQKPGLGRRLYYDKSSNFAFAVCSCSDAYYMFRLNSNGTWAIDTYSPYSLSFSVYPDGSGSLSGGGYTFISESGYDRSVKNVKGFVDLYPTYQSVIDVMSSLGVEYHHFESYSAALDWLNKNFSTAEWKSSAISDDFIGPVYAMPAAKQLITDTGTLSGLRLDVQTEDGTPDISAALDHAGVDSVDDLVAGVAAGTIPMSQVYEDMRVVPYVLTDVETGEVVTDLGVSATDAKTKAVALDKDLSIPKDVSAADAYQVTGKTWDPEMSKYKLPLFQFFPFCLPWDIYEVLTLFDAEPVAPKFTIPVGQFFTRFSGSVDTSKAADQKAVIDLGSDSWQSTFKVIRALECAAIIIGLCLTAVLLIHGGR